MNAYFNELSFTPYSDREEVKKGLTAFIECLKSLDEFGIKNIKRSNQIDNKCLLGRETYLRMLNDKGIVDDDMKSVLINRMETLEPDDELVDKYLVLYMGHESLECKGLGWASEELENTVALSLHPEKWERTKYNVKLTRLDDESVEYETTTACKHIASLSHTEVHRDFLTSLRSLPRSGKILVAILDEHFPNLIFSKTAHAQMKGIKDEDTISQIYYRLGELQRIAKVFDRTCSKFDFNCLASPESDTRLNNLENELTFSFEEGVRFLCSWHLRYTPGAGRIHFYHDPANKKVYVGHVGTKIPD